MGLHQVIEAGCVEFAPPIVVPAFRLVDPSILNFCVPTPMPLHVRSSEPKYAIKIVIVVQFLSLLYIHFRRSHCLAFWYSHRFDVFIITGVIGRSFLFFQGRDRKECRYWLPQFLSRGRH